MKIVIYDELSETIVDSEAQLNLNTGEISHIVYSDLHKFYNDNNDTKPFDSETYEGTDGEIIINDSRITFSIDTNKGSYTVNAYELNKIKQKLNRLEIDITNEIQSQPLPQSANTKKLSTIISSVREHLFGNHSQDNKNKIK